MINLPLMNDNITRDDVNVLIDFLQNNNIFTQNKNVREFANSVYDYRAWE